MKKTKITSAGHQGSAILNPIKSGLLVLTLAFALSSSAQTITTSTNFIVGATVPDADLSGMASAKIVSTPISYVTKVKVNVKLTGTFNGDIYCYLAHGGTNSILLNRVANSTTSDKGFDVVFDDASTNGDVHVYRTKTGILSGPLADSWVADGRRTNPTKVVTGDPRTALLNVFNGMNPNGEWVLFVADMEAGDIYTVNNWGLEITGYTPPSIVSAPASTSAERALNHAPDVEDITMGAVENHSRNLSLEKVQAHCFDVDGDAMYVTVSSTSTNGGIVAISGAAITYTPVANFVGEDRFTYTIDDGRGGVSSATVIVGVFPADAMTPNITGLSLSGGVFHVRFAGIPGFTYHIERTGSLSSPVTWTDIGSVVAPEDGQVEFDDTNPPSGSAFYRTASPLP